MNKLLTGFIAVCAVLIGVVAATSAHAQVSTTEPTPTTDPGFTTTESVTPTPTETNVGGADTSVPSGAPRTGFGTL